MGSVWRRTFSDPMGQVLVASATATLLATGGAGQLYRETTNPSVATGDGVAIAYRAGARVIDLEFVQFHPTALSVAGQPRFLLSEALRGEGARLINESGEAFMSSLDPAGDLAPRDRVARGIAREIERTGHPVYLSLDSLPRDFVERRFPLIAGACRSMGLDLARDRIPVGPAAHYAMAASRQTWTVARRCQGCLPPGKWPAQVLTARTAWRATRCSRDSCSVPPPGARCDAQFRYPLVRRFFPMSRHLVRMRRRGRHCRRQRRYAT